MEKGFDAGVVCVNHLVQIYMKKITTKEIKITKDSIETELQSYKEKPYQCIFEYIWNSFDAGANVVDVNYKIPESGIGYVDSLEIIDNGHGWKFDDDKNTATFLASTKSETNSKNKSLPKGKLGRGRFAFIWVAKSAEISSGNKKIILDHDTRYSQENTKEQIDGTKIHFSGLNNILSSALLAADELKKQLLLEFGWLIKQNSLLQIRINREEINPKNNIKKIEILGKNDFSDDIKNELDNNFHVEIVLWKEKPSEWSNFYFLNDQRNEIFKSSTGLNKKSDDFWHSVYVISDIFSDGDAESEEIINQQFDFDDKDRKKLKNKVKREIKEKLVKLRKPYLAEQSNRLIENLSQDNLLPDLPEYGVYDTESYNDLLKAIYIISPSLFVGRNNSEVKFICATFAGLLSSQDNHLIQIILEQLQELTEDERADLAGILERTTLSNVVKTIKEVDHRLEVVDKLKKLISEYEKETLEVKHIQKILDENFWIFGEQFRLFSTTEGALKNVLIKYAREILEIEDPKLDTEPRGELDLFLTKTEESNGVQKNIIVELKRASINLSQDNEYVQLDKYRKKILEQSMCNGENQYWEFYLIGKDYDKGISELIDNANQHGEKNRGLTMSINDGKVKIYVRKWSDILEAEWGTKMKFLKEKLKIKANLIGVTPAEITKDLTGQPK
ncbi:MAG: hypothetical protein ACD_7C00489G0005 [uncultured bacterium]|nr:MAG: hypothetical protein ACD_7C00489G0005 [uncultured bacterium]